MMTRLVKLFDVTFGITEPRIEDRVQKLLMGLVVPALPFLYGLSSILSQQSRFIGRFGFVDVTGFSAVAVGVSYLSLGLLIHVHNCWQDHPQLAGVADAAQVFLVLAVGGGILAMFVGALM